MSEDVRPHPSEMYYGIQALAAIGEAMLIACRGDKVRIDMIRKEASRYAAINPVLKALTSMCEDAAENAEWTLPKEIDHLLPGRARIDRLIDELFGKEED